MSAEFKRRVMSDVIQKAGWVVYPKGKKVMCFFCHGEAYSREYDRRGTVAQGVAYYSIKLSNGKYDNVPICIPCWLEKKGMSGDD